MGHLWASMGLLPCGGGGLHTYVGGGTAVLDHVRSVPLPPASVGRSYGGILEVVSVCIDSLHVILPWYCRSEFEGILEKTPAEANAFLADPDKYLGCEFSFSLVFLHITVHYIILTSSEPT